MAKSPKLAFAIICFSVTLAACGTPRVALPSGSGTPFTDYGPVFTAARAACESVRTFQAELGLSGAAAGQRLRGRIHAGLAPGALRLEGVPPFGSPVFILVADGAQGTLLLLRDRRVLQNAPPEEILDALVGVSLGPDDLRALLTGCIKAAAEPASARSYGPDWIAVDLAAGGTVYLRRRQNRWQIVAGRYGGLEIEYPSFADARPAQIVLRGKDLNLTLAMNQIELNGELPREALVALTIAPGMSPLTLDELRRSGPLGR